MAKEAATPTLQVLEIPLESLKPWDENPRTIDKVEFMRLKESMKAEPEMLKVRPVIARLDGTVIAGNMRLRAAQELGWLTIPAAYMDVDDRRAKEIALRDNNQFGEWQDDQLAEMIYSLSQEGSDLTLLGFDDKEIERLLAASGAGPDDASGGGSGGLGEPVIKYEIVFDDVSQQTRWYAFLRSLKNEWEAETTAGKLDLLPAIQGLLMSRQRQFLDVDVLTAAKDRLRHIYDIFDTVAVCFSGGKDSLTALHLTHEIAEEFGQRTVNVVFRDEELIPDPVIDFVNEYRQLPWVKMLYFAVPLRSTKFILGQSHDYVQWDPNRRHLRPVPEHAITLPPGDARVFDQYTMDAFIGGYYKGRIAFITGIRAAESIMRYRSAVNKLHENYINDSSSPNVKLCKPIYDWQENDVFKFFMEREIRYCALYDAQHVSGVNLRVATPFIAESAKHLDRLRAFAPGFYQQVVDLFPEMLVQERYWHDLDRSAVTKRYGENLAGVRAWIEDNIQDEAQHKKALDRLTGIEGRAQRQPEAYPPDAVLRYFVTGAYKREMLPLSKAEQEKRRAKAS